MEPSELRAPWMVAAWPGMGGVAQIAVDELIRLLEAEPFERVPPDDHFDVIGARVDRGRVQPVMRPRTVLHGWKHPEGGRDLVIARGERQPDRHGYEYCGRVLERAEALGVERVLSFAALAAPVAPDAESRVIGAATTDALLDELRAVGVKPMRDGEVGGLNGVLVAAAAARRMPAVCLLGEFPYFATTLPNPKAARALLRTLAELAGLELALESLDARVENVERQLLEVLRRLGEERGADIDLGLGSPYADRDDDLYGSDDDEDEDDETARDEPPPAAQPERDPLSPEQAARIEELFTAAQADRARALELKAELDRLGVFKRYEDRFLDMFRKGD